MSLKRTREEAENAWRFIPKGRRKIIMVHLYKHTVRVGWDDPSTDPPSFIGFLVTTREASEDEVTKTLRLADSKGRMRSLVPGVTHGTVCLEGTCETLSVSAVKGIR